MSRPEHQHLNPPTLHNNNDKPPSYDPESTLHPSSSNRNRNRTPPPPPNLCVYTFITIIAILFTTLMLMCLFTSRLRHQLSQAQLQIEDARQGIEDAWTLIEGSLTGLDGENELLGLRFEVGMRVARLRGVLAGG